MNEIITFNQIKNLFNNDWDISYLTSEEMKEVFNHPIKMGVNLIQEIAYHESIFVDDYFYLIVAQKTKNFDYSIDNNFTAVVSQSLPCLNYQKVFCNYKHATMLAGMGQYAKNSLIYHYRFGFECHFSIFVIFNKIDLKTLPIRTPPNRELISICQNCNDCIKKCPVAAIHEMENGSWVDMEKCDNFNHFNNHPTIPSLKRGWIYLNKLNFNEETINNITNFKELKQLTGVTGGIPLTQKINGEVVNIQYPVCRECTSQKRCSIYNGNYPYHQSQVQITKRYM